MLFSMISGIITGLIFILPKLSFLCFFSLIPLIFYINTKKYGFKCGFVYGFFLNALSLFFLTSMHPLDFMGLSGFSSIVVVSAAYLGICIFEGVLWGAIFSLFGKYIKSIWLFPAVYAVAELILSIGSFGLTFSNLYLVFYENRAFIQSAGLFGGYFITALTVYINLLIYMAVSKNYKYIFVAVAIFLLNISYGIIKINNCSYDAFPKEKISLIQGNISSNEKWEKNNMYSILRAYKELTLEANKKDGAEIFIWPETVVPVGIDREHNIYNEISSFAKENEISIITGAFINENGYTFNSVTVFESDGRMEGRYDKRHLIPFAEYNPFNKNKMKKGKEGKVINTRAGRMGALVCIDSAYPHLTYKTMKNNPDFIVVLSNDSWFKSSYGVFNHNAHSVFRAVESGRYVLRCANTGITNIISPTGEIINQILPERKGYITYEK